MLLDHYLILKILNCVKCSDNSFSFEHTMAMALLSVDIYGNPWHCDCENMFLKNVIIHTVNISNNVLLDPDEF